MVRRQGKSIKGIQIGKEEIKLFIEDMIISVANPKESTTQTPKNDNGYGKVVEHIINIQKSVTFLNTCSEQLRLEINNTKKETYFGMNLMKYIQD